MNPWEEYQIDDGPWAAYATPNENAVTEIKDKKREWSDVPVLAAKNALPSAANFATGIYSAVRHPVDTAMGLWDAAAGGLHNLVPASVSGAIDKIAPSENTTRAVNTANAVGEFYKNRYGGMENVKNTFATDPIGAAADVSTLLAGGATLAPKAGMVSSVLNKGSQMTNPINLAAKAAKPVLMSTGKGVANLVGGLGTHTGGASIQEAAMAGYKGGNTAKNFRQNISGNAQMTEALDIAKQNLAEMGKAKAAQYRSGMAQVSNDKTVLNFNGIDNALKQASNIVKFKGQTVNERAGKALQDISQIVDDWKNLDPAEYHTPEGLDSLKQKVGSVVESIPFEEKTARLVGNKIYNSIKTEITKQAPVYSNVMKDYSQASDQIKEIERAFSMGGNKSIDTAMRKLQSLTRNNANTNYGNRLDLMKQLEKQGGQEVMPSLAGQALNTWIPRGIQQAVAGPAGLLGYSVGGLPLALGTMAVQSPRLMGEAAYGIGSASRYLKKPLTFAEGAGIDPALMGNILYQSGRLQQ